MKKILSIFLSILTLCFLQGCSAIKSNTNAETPILEGELAEEIDEVQSQNLPQNDSDSVINAPTREVVIAKRKECLEGMAQENIDRLTENIKVANLTMERAYFYDDLFGRLSDKEDLYWNYIEQKGDIVVSYQLDEEHQYSKASGMSFDEYAKKFGTPIYAYNRFDAQNFINLMEEMKDLIYNASLKKDFDNLIEYMKQAKETHDVEYIEKIYYIVHDMDYYLLRYAPDDMGGFVQNQGTIGKYYSVLEAYKSDNDLSQTITENEMAAAGTILAKGNIKAGRYKDYTIQLIMTEGEYYTEEQAGAGGGIYEENYDGKYALRFIDSEGVLIDEISLNKDWNYEKINFGGEFEIQINDYNKDSFPDFTIGTYGSSSMNVFYLYSINEAGKIINITEKDGIVCMSKDFSISFTQNDDSTDFYTTIWNNASGETETNQWKWNEEVGKYTECN